MLEEQAACGCRPPALLCCLLARCGLQPACCGVLAQLSFQPCGPWGSEGLALLPCWTAALFATGMLGAVALCEGWRLRQCAWQTRQQLGCGHCRSPSLLLLL